MSPAIGKRIAKGARWFLPESPDVIGMLQSQADITARGMAAFAEWAAGDAAKADEVRAAGWHYSSVGRG